LLLSDPSSDFVRSLTRSSTRSLYTRVCERAPRAARLLRAPRAARRLLDSLHASLSTATHPRRALILIHTRTHSLLSPRLLCSLARSLSPTLSLYLSLTLAWRLASWGAQSHTACACPSLRREVCMGVNPRHHTHRLLSRRGASCLQVGVRGWVAFVIHLPTCKQTACGLINRGAEQMCGFSPCARACGFYVAL